MSLNTFTLPILKNGGAPMLIPSIGRSPQSFPSGSQRCASQIRENEESGGSIARRVLAEYRVQAVLTQVRLANMPGEGPTLGSNRYSPEQGELVEQRASAVSDTGERIVANRDREVSLLV